MTSSTPLSGYEALLESGELSPDPTQRAAVERLQSLHETLIDYRPENSGGGGWLARLGIGKPAPIEAPNGLYLHGAVGRGKSMLMDLFFESAQVERKRRVHFHEFMQEAHGLIHEWRQSEQSGENAEPIRPTARRLAEGAWLLCFDEFEVRDIADAMIVSRLFYAMLELGVVVVATSNRHPSELYKDGLQRDRFLPFIGLLEQRLDVFHITDGADYRLEKLQGEPVYLTPANASSEAELDRIFQRLTDDAVVRPDAISFKGRTIKIPAAASGVARCCFDDLCRMPLGPGDYLAIADRYRAIVISDIPVMDNDMRNEARRFMTLIDTLYDKRVNLIASAEAPPHALYDGDDWRFEFERTVSRLVEMQSTDYIRGPHGD